ncbi:MAG: peptide-methionine (R)-S-oxide reductase MsrB [Bacteroidia bacterium]|nr:peptide-methionine (R)-S-oxide reductase MsrB [Bacteroidia bacterium]
MNTTLKMLMPLMLLPLLAATQCKSQQTNSTKSTTMDTSKNFAITKTDEEWKQILTPEEYRVLRQKGTERPFTSEYETLWDTGTYVCKACGAELFTSNTKFDAHCGWPSFYKSIDKSAVKEVVDSSHGMVRTEVVCAQCGGHLGHVFDDGYEQPTGLRYCINGVSLGFKKKE